MSKVVYLLGAGASYGRRGTIDYTDNHGSKLTDSNGILEGIPIVSEINKELSRIIEDLKSAYPDYQETNIGRLVRDLVWLRKESANHATVDTFAKKLYIQSNSADFYRLKDTLTSFFILVQIKYQPDKRYDAFLANILSLPEKRIPDEISILTWNYDSQFEIAYREYNPTEHPSPSYWRNVRKQLSVKEDKDDEIERGKIFKLNGSAMFDGIESFTLFGELVGDGYIEAMKVVAEEHCKHNTGNHLSFAWETDIHSCYFLNKLYDILPYTETLVIIGYSFPYFNREVDRSLFTCMVNLKNIYIQDPFAERIEQNLMPVLSERHRNGNINILLLKDTEQFYLPSEL